MEKVSWNIKIQLSYRKSSVNVKTTYDNEGRIIYNIIEFYILFIFIFIILEIKQGRKDARRLG